MDAVQLPRGHVGGHGVAGERVIEGVARAEHHGVAGVRRGRRLDGRMPAVVTGGIVRALGAALVDADRLGERGIGRRQPQGERGEKEASESPGHGSVSFAWVKEPRPWVLVPRTLALVERGALSRTPPGAACRAPTRAADLGGACYTAASARTEGPDACA